MHKEYELVKEETMYRGFLDIMKGTIEVYSEKEDKRVKIYREVLYKKDAIAVLLKNTDTDEFIFSQQFRYPTVEHDDGYILEIPAGAIDHGEQPLETLKREALEEAGYQINRAELLSVSYVSPGYSTERTFIYYAEVSNKDKVAEGGGLTEETEEIELVHVPVAQLDKLLAGKVVDAKSLLALQWYKMNRA